MALTYTGTTGIFTQVGALVKQVNLLATVGSNADTALAEIQANFEAGDQRPSIATTPNAYNGYKNAIVSLRTNLAASAAIRLRDLTTVVNVLDLPNDSINTVLPALIAAMIADSATIDASAVTLGSVTAGASNTGNGTALTSVVLDGASQPGRGMPANVNYSGVDSELSVTETMTLVCTADSYTDGLTAGSERFSWYGESGTVTWGLSAEGSGSGPSLNVLNGTTSIIANGDFETFSSNVPASWTLDNGVAGTNVGQDTSTYYRTAGALKFIGDGSAATIQISQAPSGVTPRKRYCCSFRYKASATDTVAQTFTVKFTGTGYTAASSEKVTVAGDVYPTSWTHGYFFINLPAVIPSDFKLVIQQTGTPSNGKILYVDSLAFAPVTWHNGINLCLIAGSTPFVRGDKFTFTVTNNQAGVFQEFFRRGFGMQLPSSGSPTITDSLAQ